MMAFWRKGDMVTLTKEQQTEYQRVIELAKSLGLTWYRDDSSVGGWIRTNQFVQSGPHSGYMATFCPITAACFAKMGRRFSTSDYQTAGGVMGLSEPTILALSQRSYGGQGVNDLLAALIG